MSASDAQVVVNPGSAVESLDRTTLKNILSGKERYWPVGSAITLAIPKDNALASSVTEHYAGMPKTRFDTHWRRLVFSGRGKGLQQIADEASMVDFIANNESALGFISAGSDSASLVVLQITD